MADPAPRAQNLFGHKLLQGGRLISRLVLEY